ncbi:MAG: LysR family transcriptional regulator [Streptosporangiaceae bacterium]
MRQPRPGPPAASPRHLRSFAATVRAGSITRGAAALGLTQPTVTQRIHRLERAAGERILIRDPRGARVTPAGEKLLTYAERILALHDEARASVSGHDVSPAGHRALGLLEDLAITTLPTALADFATLHPPVDLEVVIGSAKVLRELADRGRLDQRAAP